jgi:hypothetical protein
MSGVRTVRPVDEATSTRGPGADGPRPDEAAALRRRGLVWPCHLPLTLAAVGAVAGGTAVGDLLTGHPLAVGIVLGTVTIGAYVRAWRLGRAADRCSTGTCPTPRTAPGTPR